MKYNDGTEARLGDIVRLGRESLGTVVFSVDTKEYSAEFPESAWSYLSKGVMIHFSSFGLIHYESPDPDLTFVARASN